jgi:polysaccharide biosynthesis transport protein
MSLASNVLRPARQPRYADGDFALSALGAVLWRHRAKIWRPTVAVALLTLLAVSLVPPEYLSEARVLVVGRDNAYLRPDVDKDVGDRVTVDQEAVTSQAQLVLSRDLALEVIHKLNLSEHREFNPGGGSLSLVKSLLGFLGLAKNSSRMTPDERALDAYYRHLTVYPVEKSRVIVIGFLSGDPELAARVANAIAEAYLKRQRLAKQEQARNASEWLSGEIASMRKKVAEAEARVEAFRAKSNLLVGPNGTTLSAQELGDLNGQLAAARTAKTDAEAKAKLIRQALKSGEQIESSDILNSELIRRLSEQRVTLRAQLAEQSASLLDNHPRIKELKAQIAALDKQIRKEAETIARSLENDAKLAEARVELQRTLLDQFKNQAATTNEQDVELRALERDAKSQRDLLESYLAKYREASARDTIASAPPDARVISRAMVSNIPAYPKKLPTVLIATLATLLLCCGIVITREFLSTPAGARPDRGAAERPAASAAAQDAVTSNTTAIAAAPPASAEAQAKTPSFASRLASFGKRLGPHSDTKNPADKNPADKNTPDKNPADTKAPFATRRGGDTVNSPQAVNPDVSARASAGTSAAPAQAAPAGVPASAIEEFAHNLQQEGISTSQIAVFAVSPDLGASRIAVKFARALLQGARTVVVGLGAGDAAIREISSDPSAPGLADLGAGSATFAEIITKDRGSALNLIVSGRPAGNGMPILSAPRMADNFAALARAYAHVVIDAGVLREGEAEAVARIAAHAILLVDDLSTPATAAAHEQLLKAGFDGVTIVVAECPDAACGAVAPSGAAAA